MSTLHGGVFLSLFKTGGGMGMNRGRDFMCHRWLWCIGMEMGCVRYLFYGEMLCLPGLCDVMVKGVNVPP